MAKPVYNAKLELWMESLVDRISKLFHLTKYVYYRSDEKSMRHNKILGRELPQSDSITKALRVHIEISYIIRRNLDGKLLLNDAYGGDS